MLKRCAPTFDKSRSVIEPNDHLPERPRRSVVSWVFFLLRSATAIAAAVGIWWVTRRILRGASPRDSSVLSLLTPLLTMAIVLAAFAWQEFRWFRPRRKLLELIEQIVAGRMPIESLEDIGGGIKPLAVACRGLLHRARSCERKVAE